MKNAGDLEASNLEYMGFFCGKNQENVHKFQ